MKEFGSLHRKTKTIDSNWFRYSFATIGNHGKALFVDSLISMNDLLMIRTKRILLLLRLHSCLSGSPVRIIFLHSFLSRASSSFLAITLRSSSMQSCHLLFGLPILLLPTTRFLILLPTYDSSLLIMWPNHLNLVSIRTKRLFREKSLEILISFISYAVIFRGSSIFCNPLYHFW